MAGQGKGDAFTTLLGLTSNKKYEECGQLYKRAEEVICSRNIDPLVMTVIQNQLIPNEDLTIQEVLRQRKENLENGNRKIKIYVAGDVAVGKTTLINVIMGGNFLPTAHGHCTSVLCEVWNSDGRRAVLRVKNSKSHVIHNHTVELDADHESTSWKTIRKCIKTRKYKGDEVVKVEIYWPYSLFEKDLAETSVKRLDSPSDSTDQMHDYLDSGSIDTDSVDTFARDLAETSVKRLDSPSDSTDQMHDYLDSGSIDTDSVDTFARRWRLHPPVCLMDFPGVEDNINGMNSDSEEPINDAFQLYLDNLENCHAFIFVIDVSRKCGVNPSMMKLMSEISTHVKKRGILFNSESAIFLCTGRPKTMDKSEGNQLEDTVFTRLRNVWPTISKDQIIYFNDTTKIPESEENWCHLQGILSQFIIKTENLMLEEQCMWLSKLMETLCAVIRSGKKWPKIDKVSEVKKQAQMYKVHLSEVMTSELSADNKGQTYCDLQAILNHFKQQYKIDLGQIIDNDQLTVRESKAAVIRRSRELEEEFNAEVEKRCQGFMNEKVCIKNRRVLVYDSDVQEPIYSRLTYAVVAILSIPVCKFIMLGHAIQLLSNHDREQAVHTFLNEGRQRRLSEREKEKVIEIFTNQLSKNLQQKLKYITSLLSQKIRDLDTTIQVSLSKGIVDRKITYHTSQGNEEVSVSTALNDLIGQVWDFYVGQVMQHEFRDQQIKKLCPISDRPVYEALIEENGKVSNVAEDEKGSHVVVKEIFTTIKIRKPHNKEKSSSSSDELIPHDSTIFMECLLMRQLSRERDNIDYEFFVDYKGSSSLVTDHHYCLQLVMKKYPCSLADTIADKNYCDTTPQAIFTLAISAARGVRFIHSNNIIHRDIKASNFLVDNKDRVVICDVGHSKESDKVKTQHGRGTAYYLAPEIYPFGLHTMESDIYSFGLVLWELFYGVRLVSASLDFINTRSPPRNKKRLIQNCDAIYNLLWKCLSISKKERPTIFKIVVELEKCSRKYK